MLLVALTGGIASGKSVAAKILEKRGCYIHCADKIAHKLMEPGKPACEKIISHFGEKILNSDKTIDRAQLGAIAFSNEKERIFLNKVLHPLVLEERKKIIFTLEKEGRHKIFVSEAALTIESGFADYFDKIIVVYCKKEVQIKRLMKRDKTSRQEAMKKMRSQMSSEEKLNYADYIIDTSGSLRKTKEQTEQVFKRLIADYKQKCLKEKSLQE